MSQPLLASRPKRKQGRALSWRGGELYHGAGRQQPGHCRHFSNEDGWGGRLEGDGEAVAHIWGSGRTGADFGELSTVAVAQAERVDGGRPNTRLGEPPKGSQRCVASGACLGRYDGGQTVAGQGGHR
jgi:hypothetical protein